MAAKKCCDRCERFMVFNIKTDCGVCLRSMKVAYGSEICVNYKPKSRRKRSDQNGKTDSSAESDR